MGQHYLYTVRLAIFVENNNYCGKQPEPFLSVIIIVEIKPRTFSNCSKLVTGKAIKLDVSIFPVVREAADT